MTKKVYIAPCPDGTMSLCATVKALNEKYGQNFIEVKTAWPKKGR